MSVKEQDNKYAIDVADVTKVYRLYEKPIDRLKESMRGRIQYGLYRY